MGNDLIKIKNQWKENALLNKDEYEKLYKESIENPESFSYSFLFNRAFAFH